jgi:uncharacterized membrane protein YjjP (DUF1212 family)
VTDPVFDATMSSLTMHRIAGGLDSSRLEQVETLAGHAAIGSMSAVDADARLEKIVAQKPLYNATTQQLAYVAIATSICLIGQR